MTCKECYHYLPCKTALETMGFVADGDGKDADKRCDCFQNAADVVEVVRCRECRNFCLDTATWKRHCTMTGIAVDYDDFCSYGERGTK